VTIDDALRSIHSLYVDTAPFIYFVEKSPNYIERMRAVFLRVDSGALTILTSAITLTETLNKPFQANDKILLDAYFTLYLKTQHVLFVPASESVAIRAAQLRAQYNLKTPDALQISAALETGCDGFLTNDLSFRRIAELPVIIVDELELEPPLTSETSI
jgi:predicted nucleic acid-binding protein